MKVLTLGGFIGSHLTRKLLNEGHIVFAVDIYHDKITEFLSHEKLIFLEQDIRERNCDLDALVRDSDLVINLIAYANSGLYIKMPLEVFQLNFVENIEIKESCVKFNRRLVQFSSCEVY